MALSPWRYHGAMYIFEGSRRIAKVAAAFWAGGFVAGAFLGGFDLTNKSDLKEFFIAIVVGLVFIGCFTVATGWIVRRFMGIPRGLDRRT
jgi:hypothetical protein